MAQHKKKSLAEKAASGAKRTKKSNNVHKKAGEKKAIQDSSFRFPIRLITSLAALGTFVLLLVAFLNPEGLFVRVISDSVRGIIGDIGFYLAIPVSLLVFVIHAFSKNRPIIMRTTCAISFLIVAGCISHLIMAPANLPADASVIVELWNRGIDGSAGGVICGLLTMGLTFLCGPWIPYIILILSAILLLLAAIGITPAGIVKAIQNRPRGEWEDEEPQEDPAQVVVNHIANRRIQHIEEKRRAAAERKAPIEEPVPPIVPAAQPTPAEHTRVDDIIRQIDDTQTPVSASAGGSSAPVEDEILTNRLQKKSRKQEEEVVASRNMPPLELDDEPEEPVPEDVAQSVKKEKVTAEDAQKSAEQVAMEIAQAEAEEKPAYCFPPIDLLNRAGSSAVDASEEMRENTQRLNETLASFNIEARIINVTRGPSVTRYEVELEKGVRLNKLTTVADDIALSLGAVGVRIAAVPGKISVVGIEVPNRNVTTVSLREVIDSSEFSKAKSKTSFSVGRDIAGNCIVGNIAKLPHMLIAGTTGSGKSVCMNSVIISLLYKASPDDVKLIMVDPKMVELGIYNSIPHLLIPVVTDPKKAAGALQWAVAEMMRRYSAMSAAGVRDTESYNSIVESQGEGTKLPRIVVIIDELADLMLVAAKEVEQSICRIAQMGRAAGIHLIIATQRPSADVITGLMKANIPSRIAFAVSSAMESRIILDTQGAEKLVGRGDMLYAPIGCGKPVRVQGCFVSDNEVEAVASYVKSNFDTDYDQQVMDEIEKKAAQTDNKASASSSAPEANADETEGDELLPAAVDVILEIGQASVSMLQRRLKLGYSRAARIVDEMEEKGIVGPYMGSKPRAILITKEQWQSMRSGEPTQLGFSDLHSEDDSESFDEDDEF